MTKSDPSAKPKRKKEDGDAAVKLPPKTTKTPSKSSKTEKKSKDPVDETRTETGLEWAVISTVDEAELGKGKLHEFFSWLSAGMGRVELAPRPGSIRFAPAQDKAALSALARKLAESSSGLVVIFAVLPKHNCPEFDWLKPLGAEHNLVFQAILKDNVLSNFNYAISQAPKELTLNEIVSNIGDGLANKIRHMIGSAGNKRHLRGPRGNLRVVAAGSVRPEVAVLMAAAEAEASGKVGEKGDGTIGRPTTKPSLPKRTKPIIVLSDMDLEEIIGNLHVKKSPTLRGDEPVVGPLVGVRPPKAGVAVMPGGLGWTTEHLAKEFQRDTDIVVRGFPSSFSQYQVAGLFHSFQVKEVQLSLDVNAAFVRLASVEEAGKAVRTLNGWVGPDSARLQLRRANDPEEDAAALIGRLAPRRASFSGPVTEPPVPGNLPATLEQIALFPFPPSHRQKQAKRRHLRTKSESGGGPASLSNNPVSFNNNNTNTQDTPPADPQTTDEPKPPLLVYGMIHSDEA